MNKFLKAADPTDPLKPTEDETGAAKTVTEEAYMATLLQSGINNSMYGEMLNEMHNAFCMGRNEYPKRTGNQLEGGHQGSRRDSK